jgi:hypothetical protein
MDARSGRRGQPASAWIRKTRDGKRGHGSLRNPLRFWSGDRIRTGDVQRGETNAPVTVCDTQTPITMHQGSRAAALFGHPP